MTQDTHGGVAARPATPTLEPARKRALLPRPEVALPVHDATRPQDEEYVVYRDTGEWVEVRVHDYPQLFSVPGLYERVVYDLFGCNSPRKISELVARALARERVATRELSVLDLGCGNGCVGEELAALGMRSLVGIDLHPEAAQAAERDRPGLYRDFVIGDLLDLPDEAEARFRELEVEFLTCVAALGFGDIPPDVFLRALSRVRVDGWVAFTIKEHFLEQTDESGFAAAIRRLVQDGTLELIEQETYVHRRAVSGAPLHYVAVVARKRRELPAD